MCVHALPFTPHVDVSRAPDGPLHPDVVVLFHTHTYIVHSSHSSTVLLPILSNPVDSLSLQPSSPSFPLSFCLPSPPLQGGKTKVAFPIVCEVPLPPTSGPPAGTIEREQVSTPPHLTPSSEAPQQLTPAYCSQAQPMSQAVQYVWHVIRRY